MMLTMKSSNNVTSQPQEGADNAHDVATLPSAGHEAAPTTTTAARFEVLSPTEPLGMCELNGECK
jgi:hypothetical protein